MNRERIQADLAKTYVVVSASPEGVCVWLNRLDQREPGWTSSRVLAIPMDQERATKVAAKVGGLVAPRWETEMADEIDLEKRANHPCSEPGRRP